MWRPWHGPRRWPASAPRFWPAPSRRASASWPTVSRFGRSSRSSTTRFLHRQPRLWVLDLTRTRVLAHELVAHGRATGDDLARRFSNRPGSLQSSLGTFLTGAVYQGGTARPSGSADSMPG
jgi:hypothetical protein